MAVGCCLLVNNSYCLITFVLKFSLFRSSVGKMFLRNRRLLFLIPALIFLISGILVTVIFQLSCCFLIVRYKSTVPMTYALLLGHHFQHKRRHTEKALGWDLIISTSSRVQRSLMQLTWEWVVRLPDIWWYEADKWGMF